MTDGLKPYPAMKDSGVPWLGEVPAHWDVASVKQRYALQLGKMRQSSPAGATDAEVAYLKVQHVQWFSVRTSPTVTMWASPHDITQFGVAAGDLLVCEGGEGGRSSIVREIPSGMIIEKSLHRVRPRNKCLNEYLQYLMGAVSATGWFDAINNRATIAHLTREEFGALRMPVPHLPEQAAIVRFLGHVDRRIRRYIHAKQKLIKLLEEQKQAIIHRAVTRGLDPNVRLKPSGVEWLGDVPAHWEVRQLRQCVSIAGGMTPSMENRRFWDGTIPWVTPKDMKQPSIGSSSVRVSDAALSETPLRLIPPPAILLVVRGMILARKVPIAVTTAPVTVNQDMKALTPHPVVNAEFLATLLTAAGDAFVPLIDEAGHGTRRLPTERWRTVAVALPPESEQVALLVGLRSATAAVDRALDAARREITLFGEYRTRLIADVVTGKLDVREAAARLPDETEEEGDDDEPEARDESDADDADSDDDTAEAPEAAEL